MAVEFGKLLDLMVEKRAAELRLEIGVKPRIRLRPGLIDLNLPPLLAEDVQHYVSRFPPELCRKELEKSGAKDVVVTVEKSGLIIRARWELLPDSGSAALPLLDIDRQLARRLDMPLRPYSSDPRLAKSVVEFAAGLGLFVDPKASPCVARYGERTFSRAIMNEADRFPELFRFILDILDGRAES